MKLLRVRVKSNNCSECRDRLLSECTEHGLPLPMEEVVQVPEWWINHNCPHIEGGLSLELETEVQETSGNYTFVESEQANSDEEGISEEEDIEVSPWWDTLDASKGIGYPVREEGRYGSYPAHDGFDDESWS